MLATRLKAATSRMADMPHGPASNGRTCAIQANRPANSSLVTLNRRMRRA